MKKKPNNGYSISEMEILKLLWHENTSFTALEIFEKLPDLDLFFTSIYLIINGMVEKGLLVADGKVRRGKKYARTYKPAITQEDFATREALKLTSNLPPQKRLFGLIASMIDHEGVDKETLTKIEEYIQKKRKEIDS